MIVYAQGHFAILLIARSRKTPNSQSLESCNQNPTYGIHLLGTTWLQLVEASRGHHQALLEPPTLVGSVDHPAWQDDPTETLHPADQHHLVGQAGTDLLPLNHLRVLLGEEVHHSKREVCVGVGMWVHTWCDSGLFTSRVQWEDHTHTSSSKDCPLSLSLSTIFPLDVSKGGGIGSSGFCTTVDIGFCPPDSDDIFAKQELNTTLKIHVCQKFSNLLHEIKSWI